jgi:hypothetical protein
LYLKNKLATKNLASNWRGFVTVTNTVDFNTKKQAPGKMVVLTPPSKRACHVNCDSTFARSQEEKKKSGRKHARHRLEIFQQLLEEEQDLENHNPPDPDIPDESGEDSPPPIDSPIHSKSTE